MHQSPTVASVLLILPLGDYCDKEIEVELRVVVIGMQTTGRTFAEVEECGDTASEVIDDMAKKVKEKELLGMETVTVVTTGDSCGDEGTSEELERAVRGDRSSSRRLKGSGKGSSSAHEHPVVIGLLMDNKSARSADCLDQIEEAAYTAEDKATGKKAEKLLKMNGETFLVEDCSDEELRDVLRASGRSRSRD